MQKLGSKLKEAKSMARQFDSVLEESNGSGDTEENEIADNEDEKDQAKVSSFLFVT